MANSSGVLRFVTVQGSIVIHAQLVVDQYRGRTVCGRPVAGRAAEEPRPVERCEGCWADYRVRGDLPRHVSARFGSPGIRY
ncbi:hypothetical protein GCM10023321_58650 [Pseudonocardia eucalypti]|uniref:Uncharacterized protein n=1 Tax=Pseudonocardia eucalypti TaxID=648755 RepID=A0ABP9QT00_9PSEU